jgi:DNA-binding MarR family transcriptional regulator/N-acetylglutamate synthase-like GNAT family acetyltransferase
MPTHESRHQRIEAVRRFNRFYTRKIGVLGNGVYRSPFTLTQARVLFEIAHRRQTIAAELVRELGLDPGYLSRILRGFRKRGLVAAVKSGADRRRELLSLTHRGRIVFAPIDTRSHDEVGAMLGEMPPGDQQHVVSAMHTIERLLHAPAPASEGARATDPAGHILRSPRASDMGWVIERHGALYAQEYGYSQRFEGLVAEIVAAFVRNFQAKWERCWIAERDLERVGSVFVVRRSETVALLRLLLVEPAARGLGIGARLVNECLRFARHAGYSKMMLWTQTGLDAAHHIYEKAGFQIIRRERHKEWGQDVAGETWERDL